MDFFRPLMFRGFLAHCASMSSMSSVSLPKDTKFLCAFLFVGGTIFCRHNYEKDKGVFAKKYNKCTQYMTNCGNIVKRLSPSEASEAFCNSCWTTSRPSRSRKSRKCLLSKARSTFRTIQFKGPKP